DRFEQVVLAALDDDDGIGARAIRDPFVLLLEGVAVVDVDRVGVRALRGRRLGRARHRRDERQQRRQPTLGNQRLPPRPVRQSFLSRLHYLREDLLEITGQRQIADRNSFELQAQTFRRGLANLQYLWAEFGAVLQQCLDLGGRDRRAKRLLQLGVEGGHIVVRVERGSTRIRDTVGGR